MTTTTSPDTMLWRAILVGGLLTIAIGAALTFWPDISLQVIGWLVAIQFVLVGAAFLVGRVITGGSTGSVMLGIVLGALGIIIGVWAFRNPDTTVAILTFLVGAGWFIGGVVEAIEATADRETPARGWVIALGVISALAGLVLLFYPLASALALAIFTGVLMLVLGIARVIQAFQIKGALGV